MELIKPITSDYDLIKLSEILNVQIDGIYELREIKKPLPTVGSYLILMRMDDKTGHWVCVNDDYYFDSYGIGPPTVLGNLKHNTIQIQPDYKNYCGIYCMLSLYSRQKHKPELMQGFTDLDT